VQTIVGDVLDNREDDDSDTAKLLAIADEQDLQFTVGEFLMETAIMDEASLDYIAGGRNSAYEATDTFSAKTLSANRLFLEQLKKIITL